jgi:hypothetical protein
MNHSPFSAPIGTTGHRFIDIGLPLSPITDDVMSEEPKGLQTL